MNPEASPPASWVNRHPVVSAVGVAAATNLALLASGAAVYHLYDQQRSQVIEAEEFPPHEPAPMQPSVSPSALPDIDSLEYSCLTYRSFELGGHYERFGVDAEDRLGALACEASLRDPRITIVDYTQQSQSLRNTFAHELGSAAKEAGLLEDPTITVVPASDKMQEAYQSSRTRKCDPVYSTEPTAAHVAEQFLPQGSHDRLVALTGRTACKTANGVAPVGMAHGDIINVYQVDLSNSWGHQVATGVHELGHKEVGHSGSLHDEEHDNGPGKVLPDMQYGVYDLAAFITDAAHKHDEYGAFSVMGMDILSEGFNPVHRYLMDWTKRMTGEHENRIVRLEEKPAVFSQESTEQYMAVIKLPEPLTLPIDKKHSKVDPPVEVDELYFVPSGACAEEAASSDLPLMISIYARSVDSDPVSLSDENVVSLGRVDPEVAFPERQPNEKAPSVLRCDEFYPGMVRQDYTALLRLSDKTYVKMSYDGKTNTAQLSKTVMTNANPLTAQ